MHQSSRYRTVVMTLSISLVLVGLCGLMPSRAAGAPQTNARRYVPRRSRAPQTSSKNHPAVKRAFRPLIVAAAKSTVAVYCQGKQVALGAIVSSDGYIVTKASELVGSTIACKFHTGRRLAAELIGTDATNDVALLKVAATGLDAIQWSRDENPAVGSWIITPGLTADPISIGVVSVRIRTPRSSRIRMPVSGFLGIGYDTTTPTPRIARVYPNTAAARAGLRAKDIITKVGTTAVSTREALSNLLRKSKPGEKVKLHVKRGSREFDITPTLGRWPSPLHLNPQQFSGGQLSQRSSGFQRILQHDSVLKPSQCGGAAVDSSGKAVGINIARAGRVESYTLPASLVGSIITKLKADAAKKKPKAKPKAKPKPKAKSVK